MMQQFQTDIHRLLAVSPMQGLWGDAQPGCSAKTHQNRVSLPYMDKPSKGKLLQILHFIFVTFSAARLQQQGLLASLVVSSLRECHLVFYWYSTFPTSEERREREGHSKVRALLQNFSCKMRHEQDNGMSGVHWGQYTSEDT